MRSLTILPLNDHCCLLQRVQEIKLTAGPKVQESIAKINDAFPDECVKFSDPQYAKELVSKLEER